MKSECLYFPDGDIVLLSLPKDDVIMAFKVDRVLLRRASPVFEGMFSLPPYEDVESYDNVPLVRLQDEADDLKIFLKVLYDPRCLPWGKHYLNTVQTVKEILLLANKYEVDHLRERIVNLLERDWPPTLTDWDANEVGMMDGMPEPCEAICLARRCGVPSVLRAAFYHLSRTDGRLVNLSLLSAEDMRCLHVGRDAMIRTFREYLRVTLNEMLEYEHKSADGVRCGSGLYRFADEVELTVSRNYDPISVMMVDPHRNRRPKPPQTCDRCRIIFLDDLESKRQTFWDLLPSFFSLNSEQ